MPKLAIPVDSACSGQAGVRCLHPSPVKTPGGGRRPPMNLDLSLLVNVRTQVLPAHPRTRTNLLSSAERSRPWSLERQSREWRRGPLSSNYRHAHLTRASHLVSSRFRFNDHSNYVSYVCVMSWFTLLLSLSTCHHIVRLWFTFHSYPSIHPFHTCYYLLLSSIIQHRTVPFFLLFASSTS